MFVEGEEGESHGTRMFDDEATGVEEFAIIVEPDTHVVVVVVGRYNRDGSWWAKHHKHYSTR